MGEGLRDYRGRLLVSHTGGLQGTVSIVSMLPELKVGVVVLTNQESGAAFSSIANSVLDHYIDAAPKDWVAAYSTVTKRRQRRCSGSNIVRGIDGGRRIGLRIRHFRINQKASRESSARARPRTGGDQLPEAAVVLVARFDHQTVREVRK